MKTIIAASLIASAGFANAATALIDFSDNVAAGAGWDVLGNGQNDAGDLAATALSTGWTLAIDLTQGVSGGGSFGNVGYGGAGINGGPGATITEAGAVIDGLFIQLGGGSATLTFANLAFNQTYDFVAHTGRASGGGDITVATATSDYSVNGGGEELSFSLTSDGFGVITFDATSPADGTLNAMSVIAVPEPSSTALLGLGGLALIFRRRK